MDRFKFFLERYQKELIIVVIICLFIASGAGIYYFCGNAKKVEQEIVEQVVASNDQEEKQDVEEEEKTVLEEKIRVDIKGQVKSPGVYLASLEDRVIDIIERAGGLTKNADTTVNNLSKKVKDEMVIMIYSKTEVKNFAETQKKKAEVLEEAKNISDVLKNDAVLEEDKLSNHEDSTLPENSSSPNNSTSSKVNINLATLEELMSLSGIGESKAKAIIEYRTKKGSFQKIEDLLQVNGIGESIFEKIKDFIQV